MKTRVYRVVAGAFASLCLVLVSSVAQPTEVCASEGDGPLCPKLCAPGLHPCANTVVDGHKVTCLGPAPVVETPEKK